MAHACPPLPCPAAQAPRPSSALLQRLYLEAYGKAKGRYEQIKALGPNYVNTNILLVMSLLAPLRKVCTPWHRDSHTFALYMQLPYNISRARSSYTFPFAAL